MKYTKTLAALMISSAMLGGCGGTGQDDGDSSTIQTDFNGVAIDGYLARALVYVDTNNNNKLDSWEARAFTDDDGRYTTGLDGTDYCADSASDNYDFCLRSNVSLSDAVIRVEGGYDATTGEPFEGSLSNRVAITANQNVRNSVVSPLTTLFADVKDTTQRSALLTALEMQETDLDVDFLDTQGDGSQSTDQDIDKNLFAKALKVQKVVTVLAERLQRDYKDFGDKENLPSSSTKFVFDALVTTLVNQSSPTTIGTLLTSESSLGSVFEAAENAVRTVYTEAKVTLPTKIISTTGNNATISTTLSGAANIHSVIDSVINDSQTTDFQDALAGSRAIEVITKKIINDDANIQDAISLFTGGSTLKDTLLTILENDNADIATLSGTNFSELDEDNVAESATFDSSTQPFTNLPGKQLHVYDELETGDSPKDAEVIFYFKDAGKLQACVKWVDSTLDANGQPEESDNTLGKLVSGSWSLINNGYSAIVTLRIAGTKQRAIVKVAKSNGGTPVFRFDFNDDFDDWSSDEGVVTQGTIPADNTECRTQLPLRS